MKLQLTTFGYIFSFEQSAQSTLYKGNYIIE